MTQADRPDFEELSDKERLIVLCREESKGVRFPEEAKRYAGIADWLEGLDGPMPEDRMQWPCPLCDAGAGSECNQQFSKEDKALFKDPSKAPFIHHWRGWSPRLSGPTNLSKEAFPGGDDNSNMHVAAAESGPTISTRGCCLTCNWRGEIRADSNKSLEDSITHAWPRWQELPVFANINYQTEPFRGKKLQRWLSSIEAVMPAWWFEGLLDAAVHLPTARSVVLGPPIRTQRIPMGNAHVPGRAPGGGYDMGAADAPVTALPKPLKHAPVSTLVEDVVAALASAEIERARNLREADRSFTSSSSPTRRSAEYQDEFGEGDEDPEFSDELTFEFEPQDSPPAKIVRVAQPARPSRQPGQGQESLFL